MKYFEKQAIDSSPVMRLAVRLRKMYGWSTPNAIKAAKGIKKVLKAYSKAGTDNRLDILQNELKNSTIPIQRIGRYFTGNSRRYSGK